jgi:hypothetical protein
MSAGLARSLPILALLAACVVNKPDESSTDTVVDVDSGGASGDCGDPGTNSHMEDGACFCDDGHVWEEPNDPNDFDCIPGGGTVGCDGPHNVLMGDVCYCEAGYDWCVPEDPTDFSCCPRGGTTGIDTGSGGGVDDTGGGQCEGDGGRLPPDSCTGEQVGFVFCSNTADQGAAGSHYYVCDGSQFVEWTQAELDAACMQSGFDFSFGCTDDGMSANIACGVGPGTACADCGVATCADADLIQQCVAEKLTQDSCQRICMEDGDSMGVQHDFGECIDPGDGTGASCCCWDDGETPCSAGGGSTG